MKLILSSLCLVLCLSLTTSHSTSWKQKDPSDFLLLRESVVRMPQRRDSWSVDVHYPKHGYNYHMTISAINVIDSITNSTGAIPSLKAGGPGFKYANVNLKSPKRRGINSTVEIWGRMVEW